VENNRLLIDDGFLILNSTYCKSITRIWSVFPEHERATQTQIQTKCRSDDLFCSTRRCH